MPQRRGPSPLLATVRPGKSDGQEACTTMTSRTTRPTERAPTPVVERLVELAGLAPSVHDTQPWRWSYDGERLTLSADRSRRLLLGDPHGRNLTISCGAALHHLQFAARALGWETSVSLPAVTAGPDVLADVLVGRGPRRSPVPADLDLLEDRCPELRRFTAWPVADDRLQALGRTGETWTDRAVAVTGTPERFRLERLANRALGSLEIEPALLHGQDGWHERRGRDDPRHVLHGGDRMIVLGGVLDDAGAWLRTGQALSAIWLEATREGMSVAPMTQPVEVESTRREIARTVLDGAFQPHLLLQVGWQAIGRGAPARLRRRPIDDVLIDVRSESR